MNIIYKILSILFPFHLGKAQDSNRFFEKDLVINTFQNDNIRDYSYLYIDNSTGSLFVGARNYVVQLNLQDIGDTSWQKAKEVLASDENKKLCSFHGKSEDYCQNYIKYIVRLNDSTLYFCGTGANTPTQYEATINDKDFIIPSSHRATACSRDPKGLSTAVYVTSGNPYDVPVLYSATVLDNGRGIISRPQLIKDGVKVSEELWNADPIRWLNEPQFVASFDVGEDIFFFFREIAVEYTNLMKKIVSRVAKVCKKDLGGSILLVNKWTTYQKARLNCSLSGSFPFYFDEIQDVQLMNNTFYGLFISSVNGSSGSAICAYTVDSVKDRFADRVYKYKESATSIWTSLPVNNIPDKMYQRFKESERR